MPEPEDFFRMGNGAIVAPAGHGKTEVIARLAALGQRTLILTHTNAGVHAIRARLKRLGVPHPKVSVDTIAGWAMRYAHAFPGVAKPPEGLPQGGAQWDQLYWGAAHTLRIKAVREVVEASYERILIDEYQDCGGPQHDLAIALSSIVPTLIFGDPMQGIFEFAGATLSWNDDIHTHFPLVGTLTTPHRWVSKNPELGEWIAETREKLRCGEPIELSDPRITYRETSDAFDMATLFDGIDGKEGSFAAIHCNKTICYRLAKAASGGYQAIEEIAANRLSAFAASWDRAPGQAEKIQAIKELTIDCFSIRKAGDGEGTTPEEAAIKVEIGEAVAALTARGEDGLASNFWALSRKYPRWKLYRSELWRDAERTMAEVTSGRAEDMTCAVATIRQRVGVAGRRLPKRTVSTPLLLKGLEFDHVVIPDATHFARERQAQAKLFYVAISRATRSLTIASPTQRLQF